MILSINDQYRIISNSQQWIVQRRRKRIRNAEATLEWRGELFFTTLEAALKGFGERLLRESKATCPTEALADVKRIAEALSQALPIRIEVTCPHCGQETYDDRP